MCKNLPILNLFNKKDYLILEIDINNQHWSAILKLKEGEKLCKYYYATFNKAKFHYPMIQKEILTVIRGIEKFLNFLDPKPFLI